MSSRDTELSIDARERVARAIHENYRRDQADRKPADDPVMAEWDELPEHLRESNRSQADHILEKLAAIGCTVHAARGSEGGSTVFSPEEIERMAEMEHDRWTAERLADGWTLGEDRDVLNKVSPHLVSWDELAEEFREWDREPVRRIPELLAGVGLAIRRRS